MNKRLAIIGVFMKNERDEEKLLAILKEHHKYLINKNEVVQINGETTILTIIIEATEEVISTMSGKIGNLKGMHAKVIYEKDSKKY
jgi:metal-responsive CopG/Arc/MetJ family transcriptional regulator